MTSLGVFVGSGRPELVTAFEAWCGQKVSHVLDFAGRSTSTTAPWRGIESPWPASVHHPEWYTLVLSLAMLPNGRCTLARGTTGAYDEHWKACARYLIARGQKDCIIRLGWEMNGLFYPWSAVGKEAAFVAYWRRIHTAMRNEGFTGRFDWCPLAYKGTNASVERMYPGDEYVDIIGLDAYDTCNKTTLRGRDRFAWQNQVAVGRDWHWNFAEAHGKQISHPEWGVSVRPNDQLGGGDNPYYVERMLLRLAGYPRRYAYACLFDIDAQDAAHKLSPITRFPNAAAAYLQAIKEAA